MHMGEIEKTKDDRFSFIARRCSSKSSPPLQLLRGFAKENGKGSFVFFPWPARHARPIEVGAGCSMLINLRRKDVREGGKTRRPRTRIILSSDGTSSARERPTRFRSRHRASAVKAIPSRRWSSKGVESFRVRSSVKSRRRGRQQKRSYVI